LDIMFDLPNMKKPSKIRITKKMVDENDLSFDRPKVAAGV